MTQENLRLVLEELGRPALLVAADGTIEAANEAGVLAAGFAGRGLVGRALSEVFPLGVPPGSDWVDVVLRSPLGVQAPVRARRLEQGDRAFIVFDPDVGDPTSFLADTSRRLLRTQLAVRAILDNVPAMISYWDRDLRNRLANLGYQDFFGKTASELPGMHMRDVLGADLFALNVDHVRRALAGEAVTFERTTLDASGAVRHIQVSYVPDVVDGQVLGFFVLVADLTEHQETQIGLRAAHADLEQFSAVAAHDLRNPLIGIVGYADLLALTVPAVQNDPKTLGMVDQIRASARHGLTLIDNLLAYSSVAGSSAPAFDVDLDELAARVLRDVLQGGDRSHVTLRPLGMAHADPVLVRSLLSNLLSNALAYVAEGVAPRVEVSAGLRSEPGWLQLRVDDNGVGIPCSEREEVFEPFHRGLGTAGIPGTGVGLAICQRVVTRYGGRIWVEDSPYGGTSVLFTLPAGEGL
jgi:PAS domain S-box-containing protein